MAGMGEMWKRLVCDGNGMEENEEEEAMANRGKNAKQKTKKIMAANTQLIGRAVLLLLESGSGIWGKKKQGRESENAIILQKKNVCAVVPPFHSLFAA